MPEQPGGVQKPELHPLIKDYFAKRQLDYNDIPAHTYETLRYFPDQHVHVLVEVLNAVGQSLEDDTKALAEIDESLESDESMTPLEKYRFVIH